MSALSCRFNDLESPIQVLGCSCTRGRLCGINASARPAHDVQSRCPGNSSGMSPRRLRSEEDQPSAVFTRLEKTVSRGPASAK